MRKHNTVDVHAHICDSDFDDDRADVLARARGAGVEAIVAVGENLGDARKNVELAGTYDMLKAAAGLYPTILDLDQADAMAAFIRRNRPHLVAIGEVGLDFWVIKEASERELQKAIFKQFVELSKALDLPVNVHSRSAGRHAVSLLLENNATRVQMHAFDGKAGTALPAVEAGYFFSIPPSVIRSRQKQKLVKQLPLSCLLVETDSPVLGPEPNVRNEPANLIVAIEAIARIKAVPREAVVAAVAENAQRLYGDLSGC
ncbi:MAG: TatD family hydrolase [Deltaproteobacteria bacterium]|nr:TatD family hydrolase [Deltaproteobacteria bacterium]